MLRLHVLCLEGGDLALAYPLVRSAVRVAPEEWQAFADDLIGGGGGVLGVRADATCLYGLAAFRPQNTLRHRRALCVELLVAIDLGRRQPVRAALQRRLSEIAKERACPNIVLTIPAGTHADDCALWKADGYVQETSGLVRQIAGQVGN
jgi:hypothetical protein